NAGNKTITRLLNENEQLRRWYGADLPDAVRRLLRSYCAVNSLMPERGRNAGNKTITRLLNENEQLRRWYGADLPDAVRRL
ncbi:hypothetical protein V5H41_28565, partial [Salmonella enterica]